MNLRKTFFILPNLFTLASLFCGFYAIATLLSGPASMRQLFGASIAIYFGFFFDMSDGRVARLTRTQSALGRELDSLADLVTFGVAPALIVYRWGLDSLTAHLPWPWIARHLGLIVSFAFAACGALRLARFNVLSIEEEAHKGLHKAPGKYIVGLPVPAAAAVLVGMVAANHQIGGSLVDERQAALAVIVLVLSWLMVSKVRFRSFKDLKLSRRTVTVISSFLGAILLAVFWKRVPSAFVFVVLITAYVALGLTEEVVFFRRRREEDAAARATAASPPAAQPTTDAEVLAELGADAADEADTKSG